MDSNGDDCRGGDTPSRNIESSASHEVAPRNIDDVRITRQTDANAAPQLQGPSRQQGRTVSRSDHTNRSGSRLDSATSAPRSSQDWHQVQIRRPPLRTPPYLNLPPNTEAVSNPRPQHTPAFELPRSLYTEPYRPRTGLVTRFNHPTSRFLETDANPSFATSSNQHGSSIILRRALEVGKVFYIDLRNIVDTGESEVDSVQPTREFAAHIARWCRDLAQRPPSSTTASVSPDTLRAIEEFPVSSYPAFPVPPAARLAQPLPDFPSHSITAPLRPVYTRDNAYSANRPNHPAGNLPTTESRLNRSSHASAVPSLEARRGYLTPNHTGNSRLDRHKGNKDLSPVKEEDSQLNKTRTQEGSEDQQDEEKDEEEDLESQATPKYRHDDTDKNGPSDQPPTGRAAGGNVSPGRTITLDFDRTQGASSSSKTSSYTASNKQGSTDSSAKRANHSFEIVLVIDLESASFHLIVIKKFAEMASTIPRPGPAKLTANAGLDEWLEEAKQCHYLPERAMKELCEMVKEVLMEGMSG